MSEEVLSNDEEVKPVESEEVVAEEPQELEGEENPEPVEAATEEEPEPYIFEDTKIKVMDNEYEIPQHIASAITSEEQAKEIKEIYEKAYGLDPLKQKRDYFKEQYNSVNDQYMDINNKYTEQSNMLNFYNKLIQKGDLAVFQRYTGISDELLLERAAQIIKHKELTPQQQAEYNDYIHTRQQQYSQEYVQQNQASQLDSHMVREQHQKLDEHLDQGQFTGFISSFDQRNGFGSFKNEVINRAIQIEQQLAKQGQQREVSIEEAVNATLNYFGYSQGQIDNPPQNLENAPQGTSPQVQTTKPVVVEEKPTIPNIKSGGKSPVKKTVRSLSQLREMAENFEYGS